MINETIYVYTKGQNETLTDMRLSRGVYPPKLFYFLTHTINIHFLAGYCIPYDKYLYQHILIYFDTTYILSLKNIYHHLILDVIVH